MRKVLTKSENNRRYKLHYFLKREGILIDVRKHIVYVRWCVDPSEHWRLYELNKRFGYMIQLTF